MPNPVLALLDKKFGPRFWPRLKRGALGLAQDFWHDGTENPFMRNRAAAAPNRRRQRGRQAAAAAFSQLVAEQTSITAVWHAEPGEIAGILWGEGFLRPGGAALFDRLIEPLALAQPMRMLNLSAGLGGGLGALADAGATVASFESEPGLAERCRAAGVTPFMLEDFSPPGAYDALIARDLFCRLKDKPAGFGRLAAALKPGGRIAFTDYIVNPEDRSAPTVLACLPGLAIEPPAMPLGLVELAEAWARAGFVLNVTEDMTTQHKKDLLQGLQRLARHLAKAPRPDAATKRELAAALHQLTLTLTALDHGLRFYRFAGVRL